MNKQDLSPELQEELEREARISAGITHERPIDREEEYFNSHGVALYNGYIGGALSDTAKRIHQEGMISVGQAKNLISLAWATASAYGDKTDEADCQDWIKHNL